jgi:molecular chaperone HtpG
MKPDQEAIYYLIGDRLETLRHHPQIEGFRKRGIEVLLFTDHVDDFWVNVVHEYKGKMLKSVTKASADLDKHTAEKPEETAEKVTSLIPLLKEIYGDAVRDVRPTQKLDESPVCLAVGEGDMDIRMERFLRENKQLPNTAYAKILEINPSHPVIQAMEGKAAQGKCAELEDMAWLLLDQARIIEGEEISDPAAFSRRLTQFLTKGLMAA